MSNAVMKIEETTLPEGWSMVKFGDMAKHISKRVEPSETDLNIYVGLEHLDPDSLRIKRHGVPGDVSGQKLLVKKGQIIFGKRRAYQRKVAVADWNCICSAHAMVLEANPESVLPDFLPFFMQSDLFMSRAVAISEGSLSPTIKWKTLQAQTFSLPSKEQQKRILDTSTSCLASVESTEQVIESLLQVRASLAKKLILGGNDYHALFGKEKTNLLSGWRKCSLGDVITRIQYGTSEAVHSEGNVPVLRMMNIENGKAVSSDLKYSKNDVSEVDNLLLKKGDILFNRTNSMEWVGRTGIFELDGDYIFASYLLRLNVNDELVTPGFVNKYLNLPLIQYRLKAYATPGVSQANINPTSLKLLPFVLPPMKKIREADEVMDEIDGSLHAAIRKKQHAFNVYVAIRETLLKGV